MKKIFILPILAAFMMVLFPLGVLAHTEGDPLVVDLLAGQTEDIGDVLVWNTAGTLYVKFVSTGDCLLKTHVHVADSLEGIPQTKKFNPIPGQFEYSDPHDCVNDYTYEIPLTWDVDTPLYIAAHASLGEEETQTIVSEAGVAAHGPLFSYAALNDSAWSSADSGGAVVTSYPAWSAAGVNVDGHNTWITFGDLYKDSDTWRWFHDEVTFPDNATFIDAKVGVTSDNAEEVYFNGALVGTYGVINGTPAWAGEWKVVNYYNLSPQAGLNPLDFIVRNYRPQSGGDNPTGLLYKAEFTYLTEGETAWGNGPGFEGKNWATYITYTVQDAEICADFSGLVAGDSVEGLDTVATGLDIQAPGNAVKIVEGGTQVYGASNFNYGCPGSPNPTNTNGCIDTDGGFSDVTAQTAEQAHAYTFTFGPGVSVSKFSLHMLDFGDLNPSKSTSHFASMTAYDASDQVDQDVLSYTSDGAGNPRSSTYGDLLCGTGDACDALEDEPGNWTWTVSGSGIVRVELSFGAGYDQKIGFDTLCFTIE